MLLKILFEILQACNFFFRKLQSAIKLAEKSQLSKFLASLKFVAILVGKKLIF